MNFIDFYGNIQDVYVKKRLRKEILERAGVEHSTFYSWFSRKKFPLPVKEIISEILEKPVEELFPETESNIVNQP